MPSANSRRASERLAESPRDLEYRLFGQVTRALLDITPLPRNDPKVIDAIDWNRRDEGFDWARAFDEAARAVLTERPGDVASLAERSDFALAAPTPEHFLPVCYVAGLADASDTPPRVLVDGYAYGSLSMACYALDSACPGARDAGPAAELPDPRVVRPEDTNL